MRASRWMWAAGLAVAAGAAATTAHGLFEVARAAGTPSAIAGLYPLITDGLALVAYATTTRLAGPGRRYAWTVVVLAAGLSGLAQAAYLAGSVHTAPPWLRFGVGAWPAVAAAVVAHLLYLLGTASTVDAWKHASSPVDRTLHVPSAPMDALDGERDTWPPPLARPAPRQTATAITPPRERAAATARAHRERHGDLPTATELARLADVSRSTAGNALKDLRAERTPLHVVTKADSRADR